MPRSVAECTITPFYDLAALSTEPELAFKYSTVVNTYYRSSLFYLPPIFNNVVCDSSKCGEEGLCCNANS